MFAIKRFEVEDNSSKKSSETSKNDRLALLNARFKKNKQPSVTQKAEEAPKPKAEEHKKDRDLNSNSKRGRQEKDEPYQQGRTKKWEKRSKELKDSDLIPNDVREAMKAQLDAAKKELSDSSALSLPS
ncbi:hypothetical protein BGZ73_000710, partial [Actinomortierella ambigua]